MKDGRDLKKLSRAELLELMIQFSEESEAAAAHEKKMQEAFEREKHELLQQMAEERASMRADFDREKEEMRQKFSEQKKAMQARFDKDINGLKERLEQEKAQEQSRADAKLELISQTGSIAEASVALSGVLKGAQDAADRYMDEIKRRKAAEMESFHKEKAAEMDAFNKEMEEARKELLAYEKRIAVRCMILKVNTGKRCDAIIEEARRRVQQDDGEQSIPGILADLKFLKKETAELVWTVEKDSIPSEVRIENK